MFKCSCPHETRSGCLDARCPHYAGEFAHAIAHLHEEHRKRIAYFVASAKGDPTIAAPRGFKYIDTAPYDGTFIKLRFRPGLGRELREEVGQWRKMDDGFVGWWDRNGDRISPGPLFWAPETGGVN